MGKKGIEHYLQLKYAILLHQVEDEGKKYWIAEIPELPGCKSHGSTVEEAVLSVEEAKKDWIEDSIENGEEVPVPVEKDRYSGKMLVRMSHSLHHALSSMADSENLSLNQLIVTILAKEVGRLQVLNRVEGKLDKLLSMADDVLKRDEQRIFIKSMNAIAPYLWERPSQWLSIEPSLEATTDFANVQVAAGVAGTVSPLHISWNPYSGRLARLHIFNEQRQEADIEPSFVVEGNQK